MPIKMKLNSRRQKRKLLKVIKRIITNTYKNNKGQIIEVNVSIKTCPAVTMVPEEEWSKMQGSGKKLPDNEWNELQEGSN